MINPFNRLLDRQEQQAGGADLLLATVAAVTSGGLTLIPDGETEATRKKYKYMTSAYPAPAAGDRVVVMRLSGTYVVLGRIGASTPAADQYVRRSGDTMTGLLNINRTSPAVIGKVTNRASEDPVEANANSYGFRIVDKNGNPVAIFTDRYETSDETGAFIGGYKMVDGTLKGNILRILTTPAGGQAVYVTSPAAWRKALQIGNSTGAFPFTVAQGGTGAATAAANRVFAGPSSGNAAAPSFRALAASDLPIVPINKGGTGQNGLTAVTDPTEIFTMSPGFECIWAYYAEWGKLAMVTASFKVVDAVTTNDWTTWATLTAGKRPPYRVVASFTRTSYCTVERNGEIQVSSTVNANSSYSFSAVYLLP